MAKLVQTVLEVQNLDKVLSALSKDRQEMPDLTPANREIGEFLMQFFMDTVYGTEGGIYGSLWAPLSPRYAAQKLRKWGPKPILIASGKMSRSYSMQVASDYLIVQNDAKTKNGDWLARFHQDGTTKMHQRVVMQFTDETIAYISAIIVKHLNNILEKNS